MKSKRFISLMTTLALTTTVILNSSVLTALGKEVPTNVLKEAAKNQLEEKLTNQAKYIKGNSFNENGTTSGLEEDIRVIVQLEDSPAIKDDGTDYTDSVKEKEEGVKSSQSNVISQVEAITGTTVKRSFGYLVNGFSINTKRKNIGAISAIDGVKTVTEVRSFKPDMEFAKKITGATDVWKDLGYKGEGMVVSIIDTGIDYRHKDLQKIDTSKIKLKGEDVKVNIDKLHYGTHFTDKVPFGYNYADGNDNVIDDGSQHGMHVAGIVAANGDDNDTGTFKAVKGVAPEAQLLAMKVFTNNPATPSAYDDDIIAAMEDSVKLGADVINMSLGGGPGFSAEEDPENMAVKNATDAGVICVISAGNSQTTTTSNTSGQPTDETGLKDTATVSSPSTAKGAFSIASMENSSTVLPQVSYESNKGTKGKVFFSNTEGSNLAALGDYHKVVDCGKGIIKDGQDDFHGQDLSGKIALIERGVTTFQSKYDNAIAHKAAGVIIYNHEAGGNLPFGMGISNITSPVFSLGRADALVMKDNIKLGDDEFKFSSDGSVSGIENTDKDDMSQFSSWGATPDLEFKPEITAPGGDIYSLANNNSYQVMSGTSMAAPHSSGSEALILQGIKEKKIGLKGKDLVTFAKNTAMNTAKIMIDKYDSSKSIPYSTRRQGAGLMQIENAIKNNVTVTYKDGKAAAALKQIGKKTIFNLELKNYGSKDITYKLENEKAYGEVIGDNNKIHEVELEGSGVTLDKNEVVVKANSTAEVTATLNLSDKVATENFVEGYIHFTSEDLAEPSLSVPYMGFYGDWGKESIVDAPKYVGSSDYKIGTTGLMTYSNGKNNYLGSTIKNDELFIEKDKVAISPNGDGIKDNLFPALYMLRNSKELKAQVIDKDGNVIKDLYVSPRVVKTMYSDYASGKEDAKYLNGAKWDGTVYNSSTGKEEKAKDGEYKIRITNSMELEGSKEQVLDLPVKLDSVAPEIKIEGVEKYKDSKGGIHYKLKWKEADNDGGSGPDNSFTAAIDGKIIAIKESDITEVNGIYSSEIPFNEGEINTVQIAGYDNAGNYTEASEKLKADDLKTIAISGMEDGLVIGQAELVNGKYVVEGTAGNDLGKLIVNGKEVAITSNYFEAPVDVKEGINTIKIQAEDKGGKNILDKEYKVILDTKNPEVTVDPNIGDASPYFTTEDNSIKFNVSVKDDTGVTGYLKNGTSSTTLDLKSGQATGEVSLKDGLNSIKLLVSDKAGNSTVKNMTVVKGNSLSKLNVTIDNLSFAQFIKASQVKNGIYKVLGHVNKNAKVLKINGQDVNINSDLTFTYDFSVKNGNNLLKVYAEDNDGKIVANYAYKAYYDETLPKISMSLPLIREDGNIYTNNSKFNVSGKVTDNMFGYSFYLNGDCLIHFDSQPVSDERLLEKEFSKDINLNDGLNHVSLLAEDEFGNKVSDDIKVILDKVAPNAPSIDVLRETNKPVEVEIKTDENQVDRIEYSFDGTNYVKYTGKIEVDNDTAVYARVVDYAGNVSVHSKTFVQVDTTAPVVDINGVKDGQTYYTPITPIATVDDKDAKLTLLLNGKEYNGEKLDVEGDYVLEAYAVDKSGNKSNVTKKSFRISQSSFERIEGNRHIITHSKNIKPAGDNAFVYESTSGENLRAIIEDVSRDSIVTSPNTKIVLPSKLLELASTGTVSFDQKIYEDRDLLSTLKSIGEIIDLSLTNSHGKVISDFNGNKVKVSIKITDDQLKNLDKGKLAAYYYDESTNTWKEIGGEFLNESSEFVFETSHFTKFTIAEKLVDNKDGNPDNGAMNTNSTGNKSGLSEKTGDKNSLSMILGVTLIALVSGAGLFISGKRRKKNS
ncbi:S8 family serine peptidase [Clostridium cibarium]|uniref:S8 family serine peptidase n=1 Tax=Clostridium cibarium TaxID=2762247 RepID=A0ABR8PRA4_9CLOT|nr:S8 family serine peptidase [Clostridium cibarium]MBD7910699.1 S8 family serine peptidase [Clostridium cibarium]